MNEMTHQPKTAIEATKAAESIAMVQGLLTIAQKFPRDEDECRKKIMVACGRLRLAESSQYVYRRGTSIVKGPSIRLAEELGRNWRNLHYGYTIIEQGKERTDCIAFAMDLERNVREEVPFIVTHERHTRKGAYKLTDPRDIYEMVANQAARRRRSCILAMIPSDVVEQSMDQCDKTLMNAIGNLREATQNMVEAFANIGVSESLLSAHLTHPVSACIPQEIVRMRRVYTSIAEGVTDVADWFDVPAQRTESQQRLDEVQQRATAAIDKAKASARPATEPPPRPEPEPETKAEPPPPPEPPQDATEPPQDIPATDAPPQPEPQPEAPSERPAADSGWVLTPTARGRIIGAFARLSLTQQDIERHLGHSIDDCTEQEVDNLRKAQQQIKKGQATALDLGFLPQPQPQPDPSPSDSIPGFNDPQPEPESATDGTFDGSSVDAFLDRINSTTKVHDLATIENDVPSEWDEATKRVIYDRVDSRYDEIKAMVRGR